MESVANTKLGNIANNLDGRLKKSSTDLSDSTEHGEIFCI